MSAGCEKSSFLSGVLKYLHSCSKAWNGSAAEEARFSRWCFGWFLSAVFQGVHPVTKNGYERSKIEQHQ
jgi:hypothetical protein